MRFRGSTGNEAEVNDDKQILTFSVTENEDTALNKKGKAWSLYVNKTAAGTDDYVFYIKNTGEKVLAIEKLSGQVGGATKLYLEEVTGTPSYAAGVVITPKPLNLGTSLTVSATIYEDTNTTGLTVDGDPVGMLPCAAASTDYEKEFPTDIIIPQGRALAIRSSAAVAVEMFLTLVELP